MRNNDCSRRIESRFGVFRLFGPMLFSLLLTGFCGAQTSRAQEGHYFGKWPALSAAIEHEDQKNLDLGESDFLLEIWFKPMPLVTEQHADAPYALISKKGPKGYRGYNLSYYDDKTVELLLCDNARNLDEDLRLSAPGIADQGGWHYLAACRIGAAKGVRLYADGKLVAEAKDVQLGSLDNSELFSVAYDPYERHSQAECRIREARVWKFPRGLPASAEEAIRAHAQNSTLLSSVVSDAPAVQYSRWIFGEEGKVAADLGNNRNALGYSPIGFTPRPAAAPVEAILGKTVFVDQKSPQASDSGPGTKERPFKTIHGGLKAAEAGDCVRVLPGLYRETLRVPSGRPGKPVTVQGQEGAVVTGADPLTGWEKQGDKLWVIKGWTGGYVAPIGIMNDDARAQPDNLLFVEDQPMDWAARADLTPGSWTIEPLEGTGPKDIFLYPLPGVVPTDSAVEISVRPVLVTGAKYANVRGLHLTRAAGRAVEVKGVGWLVEDNLIDWPSWVAIDVFGQDHVVRNNRLLWCGNSALGGSSIRLRFENNLISYCAWRPFNPNWHGGSIKLIPGNLDHVTRKNTLCYNNISGVWYDALNNGNVIEENVMHDCSGHGGVFDEISFGNFIRDNLIYNIRGPGLLNNSANGDQVTRNIVYNVSDAGIVMVGANRGRKIEDPAVVAANSKGLIEKLNVRRYQGMIDYEREKRFRELSVKYWYGYEGGERAVTRHNVMTENVIFDVGGMFIKQGNVYGGSKPLEKDAENTYDRNIYWTSGLDKLFQNGRESVDLATWQKLSGQDVESRMMDPFASPEKMPDWFRARFHVQKDEFRPIRETLKYVEGTSESISLRMLLGRLLRSKKLEKAAFADPKLHGVYFDLEGTGAVALWREDPAALSDFLLPSGEITIENKWLQRKPVKVSEGRVSLLVGREPLTLIGVNGAVAEDEAVMVDITYWNEPGKNVPVKLKLMNPSDKPREFSLKVSGPEGWTATKGEIALSLKSAEKNVVDLELVPPAQLNRGSFQMAVTGTAGAFQVKKTMGFSFGSRSAVPQTGYRYLECKGDLAGWGAVATGAPAGRADAAEQVVFLKTGQKWGGPSDLSAKVRLMWEKLNVLYIAVEVMDDKLDTHMRKIAPSQSDSVEIFLDVRPAWKQYMDEYSSGVCHFVVVPSGPDSPQPTIHFVGPSVVGVGRSLGCRRTENGYVLEMRASFLERNMEEPWTEGRSLRMGVLVNDSDDPSSNERKSRVGVWRTADNCAESCSSWTAFVLGK